MKTGTIYKGNCELLNIEFTRAWAMPNAWTFEIQPIKYLLNRYVEDGQGWVDPFSGKSKLAQYTNDHNPVMPALYHMEALEFAGHLQGKYKGILFDPPYSFRQISEHYKLLGQKASRLDTSSNFYGKVMNAFCNKIKRGGVRDILWLEY